MFSLPIMLLTTFISVGGQIQAVPKESPQAVEYKQTETDIGKYEIETTSSKTADITVTLPDETLVADDTIEPIEELSPDDVSGGDILPSLLIDNTEITELLNEQIELLAENSSSVTGTMNSTVLDLMDRMVDDLPSYYKYAGFRTNADDAYQATLYISKDATYNNNVISFGDDCIAVRFFRLTQGSNYNYYLTYERYESPNSTVRINNNTIIYTNVVDGFPALGNHQKFEIEYFWIGIFLVLATIIFTRRLNNA